MKSRFIFILLLVVFRGHAQIICGTAPEGGSVTLTAPANATITSINFASYGTPNGSCGSFTIGGCHASNSQAICASIFVGQNSASISATNGVFGDPCGGTAKRLYIQATYSFPLPLTLLSFNLSQTINGKTQLIWQSAEEVNTLRFIVEKSNDGNDFSAIDSLAAAGSGSHNYTFTDQTNLNVAAVYYRLKMVDRDGNFQYSKIVRFDSRDKMPSLVISPMVISGSLRVISNDHQSAAILNSFGQVIRTLQLVKGDQIIFIGDYPAGFYFIKTINAAVKFLKL